MRFKKLMKKNYKVLLKLFVLLVLAGSGGCVTLFQPDITVPIQHETFGNQTNPEKLVVLLPGRRDRIAVFQQYGLIDSASEYLEANPASLMITVDAHWGYYRERVITQRLQQDLLAQYPQVPVAWVAASMGGLGAQLMALEHPQRTEQLFLMAPLLGEDNYKYLERIKRKGFVDQPDDDDLERVLNRVWRQMLNPQRGYPMTIAYGVNDSFAPYYQYLESLNPPNLKIIKVAGGHDWDTWAQLWKSHAEGIISPAE